jgi:hypothetical protein
MTMTTATMPMTATENTPTEDERMMALVKACQNAMIEGDDADSVEGLPSPDSDEESWGDAIGDGESKDVLICWQDPHGYHFKDRYDALLHDAEWADVDDPVVEGSARPIYARVEAYNYVPDNARQSVVTITAVRIGEWETEDVDMPVDEDPDCLHCHGDEWLDDHDLVGGCAESPGVWASGHGSVSITTVCKGCGATRVVDYGATSWDNGRQITKVTFGQPDPDWSYESEEDED